MRRTSLIGALLVVAALAYLSHFVDRGWVPHDEGLIGQSADLVLRGGTPHVDYQEAYTGGLSQLYAALFRIVGVDLLHVRWLLFAGATWAVFVVHAICRRYLPPIGAALATWVALTWSFPNYFAGLPSWWLLICALTCVWALIRHDETSRWRYVLVAGLSAGLAVTVKQTGVYLVLALAMSVAYGSRASHPRAARWVSRGLSALTVVFVIVLLRGRLFGAEGLYLGGPVAACAIALWRRGSMADAASPGGWSGWNYSRAGVAILCAGIPMAVFLAQYASPDRFFAWVNGAFVQPRLRLGFAASPMASAVRTVAAALPLVAMAFASGRTSARVSYWLWWPLALALPVAALFDAWAYQPIWQSARVAAALLPMLVLWYLCRPRGSDGSHVDRALFFASAALALVSLNQFPFAEPVYFCYTAPLVVVCAVIAARAFGVAPRRLAPWGTLLLLFAVLSTNRGFLNDLGVRHEPVAHDTPLDLPRAHLRVSRDEAAAYRQLTSTIEEKLHGGRLVAGPDCPEVYFLAGRVNPGGVMYEFMASGPATPSTGDEFEYWKDGTVVVMNLHPDFSPPLSDDLIERLRREFPSGEWIHRFEVRWR